MKLHLLSLDLILNKVIAVSSLDNMSCKGFGFFRGRGRLLNRFCSVEEPCCKGSI